MKGFFSQKEVKSITRPTGKLMTCATCGRYQNVHHVFGEVIGDGKKGILNVFEMPSQMQDYKKQFYEGREVKLLETELKKLGISLTKDCYNIFATRCFSFKPGKTNSQALLGCRPWVMKTILRLKPKLILLHGLKAVQSVVGIPWHKEITSKGDYNPVTQVGTWRGWTIPDQYYNAWICPQVPPSGVEELNTREVTTVWRQDLKRAVKLLDTPLVKVPQNVIISESTEHTLEILNHTLKVLPKQLTFDYETTGLKPHAAEHRIVCASISFMNKNEQETYSFPFKNENREFKKLWRQILQHNQIGKIAHNMEFEHIWTLNKCKFRVQNWVWDSMQAAHILDNRSDVTGLKFQTYVNFGIAGYDDDVAPYIKGREEKNANSLNKIDKLWSTQTGKHQILLYCGYDSLYTLLLAFKQQSMIGRFTVR